MTRAFYGASPADFFIDSNGAPIGFATATVWSARTGGVQITDLLNASGTPVTFVTADVLGGFRFSGPDGTKNALWIQGVSVRYVVNPVDVSDRLTTAEAGLAAEITNRAAAISTAYDNAVAAAAADVDQELLVLAQSANPYPQYGRLVNGTTGLPTGGRILVVGAGGVFPPVEVGSVLIYGGGA